MRKKDSKAKRWCFTLNNPTEEEKELVHHWMELLSGNQETSMVSIGRKSMKLTYLIVGQETGENGTFHFQGYLELQNKLSLTTLKRFLTRAHWEKAKGTSKQASDYCKKEGTYEEAGTLSKGQGYRSDLLEIKEKIDNGATEETIADQHFSKWVVYRRSFQAYAALKAKDRNFQTITHVYWGKTGTGKTRFVMDQIMDSSFWTPGDYKWFDGYEGQDIVIIDDFRGEYKLQMLLKLLDRYPMQVPIKGGFTTWAPKKVYITSNIHPNEWYPLADKYSVAAMFRRFHRVEACFDYLY